MQDNREINELMQSVTEKSLKIMTHLKEKPVELSESLQQFTDLHERFQELMDIILNNPEKIWQMQISYWQDALTLVQDQFNHWSNGTSMPVKDQRFSGEAWVNHPFFNLLSQHYLLATEHIGFLLATMEYKDNHSAKRLHFFIKQYLDALSPANFLHTNPQLIAQTIQSRGKNLLQGLHNLLADLEHNPSQLNIKMTDRDAFKLGVNLAITPGKVIFRNGMMELIQYTPQTAKVKQIPLLIIPPWINKYYILDLSPNNSFIKWLVSKGITVFIISWINPDKRFAKKTLYDYLKEGPSTALDVIQQQLQVSEVNTLGFCIGGTLLAMLLAYNKAQQCHTVRSATFLASMIDFSDPGDIAVFIDEQQVKQLETQMDAQGYLEGKSMASSFNSLRANDLIWSFVIKNYLEGKNPAPFDILFWNADSTNMPATMHSQYLRWMYLQNDLIKPGKICLNKTPIDIRTIDIPTFFLSTQKDHIAPWKTTYNGYQLMNGPKRFVLGGSGHIAGIINPPHAKKYNYRTHPNCLDSADEWLEQSVEHPGSWWDEWLKWLKTHSGKAVAAPQWNKLPFTPLMDAPGKYVFKKS